MTSYTLPISCPICGGDAYRSEYVPESISCSTCQRIYSGTEEINAALVQDARRWWATLDDFTRGVMRETHSTLAIKRIAVRLLEAGIRPEIVESLAIAVNAQLPRPVLRGELDEALIESARIIGRRRHRSRGAA